MSTAGLFLSVVLLSSLAFDRDFRTREGDPSLDGFEIVRHYDGVGKDAMRFAGGYGIAFPFRGNVHLARMSGQRDCTVDCSMCGDPSFGDSLGFDVYYRYDKVTRTGGVLDVELDWKTGRAKVRSGTVRKLAYEWTGEAEVPLKCDSATGGFEWRLELAGRTVRFGSASFPVPDGVPSAGGIGFDKYRPSAPLVIGRLSVVGECTEAKELFPRRVWRFPRTALCSMSDWKFVFAATNAGPHTVISASVEGGPAEAFNREIGYTRHLPNEAMDRPWFAVVGPDGAVGPKQYLFFGRIGYREHWFYRLPWIGPADIECPVRRTFRIDGLSAGSRLLIGFDGFLSEDRRYIGNPRKMMLVDPTTGETVAVGDVLDANGLALEVDSGRDKRICGLIPKSTSGYDEALDYAVRNHFLFEDEPARFSVRVRAAEGRYVAGELSVECTLQDAFKDDLRTLKAAVTRTASSFPSERGLTAEVKPLTLPIGVYHLGIEIKAGGKSVIRKSVAFEVLGKNPDSPRPQMASGLPEMMSPICDYQSESNVSDYRGMGGNDLTHYFAINGMQVLPTVEKDDWDLNRLYRRRYFGWFLHRLVPEQKPETYESHFKDIDYLCTPLVAPTRLDVCSPGAYRGEVRKLLADFLRGKGEGASELARVASDASVPLTAAHLRELFERFGQEWMDRAAEHLAEKSAAAIGRWKGVRELVQYFTVPYYVWHCKGAFHTKTYGVNMLRHPERTWFTGFGILEDYPYLVGASQLEGVYAMAALKMDAPELSLAPEVKGMCAIPSDTATVYGCPPYGVMNGEDATFKRFIDLKYTTCWYRDGGFRYWTDDRMLLCNPTPDLTDNVLGAWREVRRHAPVRPVRTYAIVTGTKCCSRRPLRALEADFNGNGFVDIVNTAEEFPFWAALAVKGNGLPNGFLIRPEEIERLTPDDVHTLILPPLDTLTGEERLAVRKLYDRGVNLVASENADGMEDVFGVTRLPEPAAVGSIGGEPSVTGAAAVNYAADGAETLLADDGGRTVLALKSNGRASAAFYTLAPTLFSRAYHVFFAMQSGKVLPRSAADLFRRMLPSPEISLGEGRLSACRDKTGGLELCVMEDAQPMPAKEIFPVLTLRGDYRKAVLDGSKPCTVLKNDGRELQVRFHLAPRECVTLHIGAASGPVSWPMERLVQPPQTFETPVEMKTNGVETVFLEGEPYHGQPTRIFAYYGVPKRTDGEKVPAMVLVHGGNGSAFYRWVKRWNDRGYAAISIDTCGSVSGNVYGDENRGHRRHKWAGPEGWGGYLQTDEAITDQWTYHAVAAVIRANSFLRAQPGVDPGRIGLTGVSWGGYLTCIAASVDHRFAFAAPVYGTGFVTDPDAAWMENPKTLTARLDPAVREKWTALWDPRHYFTGIVKPVLWLDGTNDGNFSIPSLVRSQALVAAPQTAMLRINWPHGHGAVSEAPPELFAFADSLLKGAPRLPRITACTTDAGVVTLAYEADAALRPVRATLNWTLDSGVWAKRTWKSAAARMTDGTVTATVPAGASAWYVNLECADGKVVSSRVGIDPRPYEFRLADRRVDPVPALVDFEDGPAWTVTCENAVARFEVNGHYPLFGQRSAELVYRATGDKPSVRLRPAHPLPVVPEDFDTFSVWIRGCRWTHGANSQAVYAEPIVEACFVLPDGSRKSLDLQPLRWMDWNWVLRSLTADERRTLKGAAFDGFRLFDFSERGLSTVHFDNVAFWADPRKPLRFRLTRLSTFAWAANFFRGVTPRDGVVCRESSRIAFRNAV